MNNHKSILMTIAVLFGELALFVSLFTFFMDSPGLMDRVLSGLKQPMMMSFPENPEKYIQYVMVEVWRLLQICLRRDDRMKR